MRKRFNNVRSFATSRYELLEERVPLAGDFAHGVPMDQNDGEFSRLTADLFNWGDNGQKVYYGPTITKAMDGSLLVFVEGRFHHQDDRVNNILMRRSTDGGNTWSEAQTLVSLPPWGDFMAMGVPLVDETTGTVFFLYTKNVSEVFVIQSNNHGVTWTAPRNITPDVKVLGPDSPAGHPYPDEPWGWYVVGPGHGVQLKHGQYAGRLVVPADHRTTPGTEGPSWSHVIYSDDHGQTWKLGGGLDQTNELNNYSNEASVVERLNGDLYMSIRDNSDANYRSYSRSTDGGATWSTLEREWAITQPHVQGSTLRVNDNLVLFSSPDDSIIVNDTRRQLTIWASYNDTQTWVKKKVVFFGYAGYSDMAMVDADTVALVYNRGHVFNGLQWYSKVEVARFDLSWLDSPDPYEFSWYFNEKPVGSTAPTTGAQIQDYGIWDNRAQLLNGTASTVYVAGQGSDPALALTKSSFDYVRLSQIYTQPLNMGVSDSLTAQVVFRTTDTGGVLLGSRPDLAGWTLELVNGTLQFSVYDGTTRSTLTTSTPVNDGQWHHVAVVRDGSARRLRLYLDRNPTALNTIVDSTTKTLAHNEGVALGAYINGASQLTVDVDTVRITRRALSPTQFIPQNFDYPQPPPLKSYPTDAPNTWNGNVFWLPSYDYSRQFADMQFSEVQPVDPVPGAAIRSLTELSPNQFRVQAATNERYILHDHDNLVGDYWSHQATPLLPAEWLVQQHSGVTDRNFDFVQNTGQFTLSVFIKPEIGYGAYMEIFDTNESSVTRPGFSLYVNLDRLRFTVGTADGARLDQPFGPTLQRDQWYHVAVVGRGTSQPVDFFVTPVAQASVARYQSSTPFLRPNGDYPTDTQHALRIGARSRVGDSAFRGGMVDQMIFNRSLSQQEVQRLFNFTKSNAEALTATITAGNAQSGVNQIQIVFNEPVTGFSLSDLTLQRDNGANLLTAAQTLTTTDNRTFILGNLGGITRALGTYRLTLTAAGSGIVSSTGEPLSANASEIFVVQPSVEARHVFYNNSAFDDPSQGGSDDLAIAPDKEALFPGGRATFANYTSYLQGINGVMVDIANLPASTLTANDFEFRVGNDNVPNEWSLGPAPTSITVRRGAGVNGSDRVTLTWPNFTIVKQWLQVTVRANGNTGLPAADVFYFGNAIGEAGHTPLNAQVTAIDEIFARNNPRSFTNPAPIDFPYDYNRDKRVTAIDQIIARNNRTSVQNRLELLNFSDSLVAQSVTGDASDLGTLRPQSLAAASHDEMSAVMLNDLAMGVALSRMSEAPGQNSADQPGPRRPLEWRAGRK